VKRLLILLAMAALLTVGAGDNPLQADELLKLNAKQGFVFGRLAPLSDINDGWAQLARPGGPTRKVPVDQHGFFFFQGKPGPMRLLKFGYEGETGEYTIILDDPFEFGIVAAQATYIGQVIVSPFDGQVRLTDDFVRDRNWFTQRFGPTTKPVSAFPNDEFYRLIETHSQTAAPTARVENKRAYIAKTRFLKGDVWPGVMVQGPGGVDLTQIPPRETEVNAYWIDLYPTAATAMDAEGDRPAVAVTWAQADAYCRAQGGRLPTEAEYELAARGPRWDRHLYAGAPRPGASIGDASLPALEGEGWSLSPYNAAFQATAMAEWTADLEQQGSQARIVRAGPYRFAVSPETQSRVIGFRCVYSTGESAAAAPAEEPSSASGRQVVVTQTTDIYAGPDLNAAVVGQAVEGTRLTAVAESGQFILVRLDNGEEGFVPADRVKNMEMEENE